MADDGRQRIKTTRVRGAVDLSTWTLEAIDQLSQVFDATIKRAAAEAITLALESDDLYAQWPAQWGDDDGFGGPAPTDPLTIYIQFGLGPDGRNNEPLRAVSLRDALRETLTDCREDGSYAPGLTRIRDGLTALAAEITETLAAGAPSRRRAIPPKKKTRRR